MIETVFASKRFRVEHEDTEIRGKKKTVERIVTSDAVLVVPFIDKDTLLLEKSFRPVIGKQIFEFPAGMMDKDGEDQKSTAIRELEEELGYKAANMDLLFEGYSSPGRITEKIYFFKATGLTETGKHLGDFEVIEPVKIKLEDALGMVKRNEIEDTHAIAALLFCSSFGGGSL
ncbi:MAG: NUDIX hydrolase [Candidatus Marsarchaeota archaeon]|nr:NUDIX hydrolase [Candidatus Marsarchaeota archaeon]